MNKKIAFLSSEDPLDQRSFSGSLFYMHQALSRLPNVTVEILGQKHHCYGSFFSRIRLRLLKLCPALIRDTCKRQRTKQFCQTAQKQLSQTQYDRVVAPVSSKLVANLNFDNQHLIFVTDATPKYIQEEYGYHLTEDMLAAEAICLQKSNKTFYSSEFMRQRALEEYTGIPAEKIAFARFGLNLNDTPKTPRQKSLSQSIRLLFVGKDWQRKGGEIALDATRILRQQGYDAHLTIVGCTPSCAISPEEATVIPYLDKNMAEQQVQYFELLTASHFFLLPTRADCTPMVIAEANAFGTPVIATQVGGIPSLIDEGRNGHLVSLEDDGEAYAQIILGLFNHPEKYIELSKSSYRFYEQYLTWNAWAQTILSDE